MQRNCFICYQREIGCYTRRQIKAELGGAIRYIPKFTGDVISGMIRSSSYRLSIVMASYTCA